MKVQVQPHVTTTQRHLPFGCVALVLQGGGVLADYQAGVLQRPVDHAGVFTFDLAADGREWERLNVWPLRDELGAYLELELWTGSSSDNSEQNSGCNSADAESREHHGVTY